eukprot:Nitzschia sp. Nitz4//scaffold31_size150131//61820//62596//NITZ4_002826-RA/size150131-processed-gene-0.195-mRNA-1//1//CDS//3329547653//3332//frame0
MKDSSRHKQPMPRGQTLATLDLHGFTTSQGVAALTRFLEDCSRRFVKQQAAWVLVITGKGSHGKDGPVMRSAIQAVLEKRKIQFSLRKDKGSFEVNVHSGIVLYPPPQPADSKVLIKNAPTPVPELPSRRRGKSGETLIDPTPREIAACEKAIVESLEHHRLTLEALHKEETLLTRALSESLFQAEQEDREESLQFAHALSLSTQDHVVGGTQEEEMIQLALAESLAAMMAYDGATTTTGTNAGSTSNHPTNYSEDEL